MPHSSSLKRSSLEDSKCCSKISMSLSTSKVPSQKCKWDLPRALMQPPYHHRALVLDLLLITVWSFSSLILSTQCSYLPKPIWNTLTLTLTTIHISTVWWSFKMPLSPEKLMPPLNKVNVSFYLIDLDWRPWWSRLGLCPCIVSRKVSPTPVLWQKICKFPPILPRETLSLTCQSYYHTFFWQTGNALVIFVPKKTPRLFVNAAFLLNHDNNYLLISPVWHNSRCNVLCIFPLFFDEHFICSPSFSFLDLQKKCIVSTRKSSLCIWG